MHIQSGRTVPKELMSNPQSKKNAANCICKYKVNRIKRVLMVPVAKERKILNVKRTLVTVSVNVKLRESKSVNGNGNIRKRVM